MNDIVISSEAVPFAKALINTCNGDREQALLLLSHEVLYLRSHGSEGFIRGGRRRPNTLVGLFPA